MDEFNLLKNRISSMIKKDTGSLQVRDFTDEIYKPEIRPESFVEHFGSEIFSNLLIVVNNEKLAQFSDNMEEMMRRYYENVDSAERKKVRDMAKQKFQDIMRNHKKYQAAKEELDQEQAAGGAPKIEEEKKNDAMSKL